MEDVTDLQQDHQTQTHQTQAPAASTLGELRASGHELKPLRQEIRDNLLARLRAGGPARTRGRACTASPTR